MEAQKKRSAIQPEEIIAHLQVLATFHKLKLDVQARAPHNPIGLWTVFLGYAVEKFASWISNVIDKEESDATELTDEEFPTLDVAMIWHAYILNPVEYHNDCQKSQKGLSRIRAFPVRRMAEVIDTLGLEPRFPVPVFGSRGVRIGPQFSIDLVAAVKRQASFIAQVAAVGWTQRPKSLGSTVTVFIDRYHCFLKKLWENPNQLVVPTLEIDLAWHTHQLNVETYRQDSMMLFGRVLQHDDDLPSPEVNRTFKRSSYDWRNLFHMDYSTGSIHTGFRPLSSSPPVTPIGPNRPSSMDNSRTNSEVSLQEVYRAISEKRLSDVPSSFYSLSPPSSSGRGSTPSPSASPIVGTSSSGSDNDSPPYRGSMIMMLQPNKNDSTSTISPMPSNHGSDNPPVALITDSRASSSSELSSMFAYKVPLGTNDGRGAFDRPPLSGIAVRNSLHVPNLNSGSYGGSNRRPASAGNPSPLRPALKRSQHHTSNSTGTLYVPEMPSPLSQSPKLTEDDQSQYSQSTSQTSPYPPYNSSPSLNTPMTVTMARKMSMELRATDDLSRSSSGVGARSKVTPPSAYRDRPSSSGKSPSLSPPSAVVSKRPSTAGGAFTSSLNAHSSRIPSTGNGTPQMHSHINTKGQVPTLKGTSKGSARPSTAPHPTSKGRSEELSRSSSFFKKKPKAEKSTSQKRSWFRFW